MDNTQPETSGSLGDNDQRSRVVVRDLPSSADLDAPVVQPPTDGVPRPQSLSQPTVVDTGPRRQLRTLILRIALLSLAVLTLIGVAVIILHHANRNTSSTAFASTHIPLTDLPKATQLANTTQTLAVNGQLQVSDSLILNPSGQPSNPTAGQVYYDQNSNEIAYYNGKQFLNLMGSTSTSNTQTITNVTNVFNSSTGTVASISGADDVIPKFSGDNKTLTGSILTDNGDYLQIAGGLNLIVSTSISNLTFWAPSTVPTNPNVIDLGGAVELGLKFTSDVSGVVNGVRFYRGTTSTGPYVGSLWTSGGTLLAQATYTVNGFGWQEVKFNAPVPISPDTTYVVSYHTMGGGYAADSAYFGSAGVDNGPIHALASGVDGGNGVFKYAATPTFPTQSFNSSNYWDDVDFSGATYGSDARIRVNGTQLSSNDLQDNSNIAKRTSSQLFSGHNSFRNANDSTDAFDIQQANTTALFTVDTTDARIYIGPSNGNSTGTLLILSPQTNNTTDPPGVAGAMYYNLNLESFRCYNSGMWVNCGTLTPVHSFSLYDEFMGGQTTSLTNNDNIGELGWHASAIGANGSLSFDPTTPTPIADRPGVLALQTPAVANQGTTLSLGTNGGSMIIGQNNTMRTAVAVGAATGQVLRVGLDPETTATTQPISGVWWEADPSVNANWRYCYGDGTTAHCAATTTAIAANTWVRLEIRVTATGTATSAASYYIGGVSVASLTNITIDTTNRVSPEYTCYSESGSAQSCYWDYFQFLGTTSAAR